MNVKNHFLHQNEKEFQKEKMNIPFPYFYVKGYKGHEKQFIYLCFFLYERIFIFIIFFTKKLPTG